MYESGRPGFRSIARVPAEVPSVTHNSQPVASLKALKKTLSPAA